VFEIIARGIAGISRAVAGVLAVDEETADVEEQQDYLSYKNAVKMWTFLLEWFVMLTRKFNSEAQQKTDTAATMAGGKGRGKVSNNKKP
jgi:hypothetical protein